jgi:hypothetical protein
MAYIVNRSDGSVLATVPDGSVNTTSSSITLIGKNYAGYGEALNENFVRMLENFSAAAEPTSPQTGQLWWDNQTKVLRVYDAGTWKRTGGATSSATEPTGSRVIGDFWWDTTTGQLNIYDGSQFILVGPQGGGTAGESGSIVTTITDSLNVEHVVVRIAINDTTVAYYSKDAEFVPASAISGFASIKPGLNLSTAISGNRVSGNLTGNVTSIGVNTFGSASITAVTESTTTSTGALVVTGGVGIGARLNVGGNLAVTSGTAASSTTVAALTVSGGVGITGSQYVGGNALVTGNVGIGTNSPAHKFHIEQASGGLVAAAINAGNTVADTSEFYVQAGSTWAEMTAYGSGDAFFIGSASTLYIGNHSSGPVLFLQNNAERMRIDASGNTRITSNLGIGTSTTPIYPLDVASDTATIGIQIRGRASDNYGTLRFVNSDSSLEYSNIRSQPDALIINAVANIPMIFFTNNAERMRISATGTVSAQGDIVAFASSDSRLKTDLHQITNALEKVSALNGFEFSWNDLAKEIYPERTARDVGVIAQEVQSVLPEVVTERADGYLAVKYEKLVPLLIEAIKELRVQVRELQAK